MRLLHWDEISNTESGFKEYTTKNIMIFDLRKQESIFFYL